MPPTPTPSPTPTPPPTPVPTPTPLVYSYLGTDCSSNLITVYSTSSLFQPNGGVFADANLQTPYNGYFIYSEVVYFFDNGSGVLSSCPLPPTPPSPTPAPTFTDPNILKTDVHSNYETGSGVWIDYRSNITGLFFLNSGTNQSDYRDHLIREFNRKIGILNQDTGLFISPFDDGFRYAGV